MKGVNIKLNKIPKNNKHSQHAIFLQICKITWKNIDITAWNWASSSFTFLFPLKKRERTDLNYSRGFYLNQTTRWCIRVPLPVQFSQEEKSYRWEREPTMSLQICTCTLCKTIKKSSQNLKNSIWLVSRHYLFSSFSK